MPTVLRIGPYRFYFYSSDGLEPIHVHVEREGKVAKYWVSPARLARSGRFSRAELIDLQKLVEENREEIERRWNEYFA